MDDLKIDFVGIGATKSGTSWIFRCLKEHPQICGSIEKETHFFDRPENYDKGIDYYQSFFKHCTKSGIKGEFTSTYLDTPFEKEVPSHIYEHFPNVKIIVCLRDPIERAYSHYRTNIYNKGFLSSYSNFLDASRDRRLADKGFYYKHLKKYFEVFPRENILVLIYEDLKKNPLRFIQGIYSFLGVDSSFVPQSLNERVGFTGRKIADFKIPFLSFALYKIVRRFNRKSKFFHLIRRTRMRFWYKKVIVWNRKVKLENNAKPSRKKMVSPEVQNKLYEVYKDDIYKLELLLSKDLSHWKKTKTS
jgi:hypothetical protein